MSKAKCNVINPDELVQDFGVDSVPLHLLFIVSLDQRGSFQLSRIHGSHRFLQRVWNYQISNKSNMSDNSSDIIIAQLSEVISKVSTDIEDFKFNTAISALMGMLNQIQKENSIAKKDWESFLKLLSPFAPHITDELWQQLGHNTSIHLEEWPKAKKGNRSSSTVRIAIQVNGKVRGALDANEQIIQEDIISMAKKIDTVSRHLQGKSIERVIYIPGKILNLVVK